MDFSMLIRRMMLPLLLIITGCQADPSQPTVYDLVFCAEKAVYAASLETATDVPIQKIVTLPNDATCPLWSPDGQYALLYRFKRADYSIDDSLSLIERANDSTREIYHFGPRDTEWAVRWLSDGLSLSLMSARDYQSPSGEDACARFVRGAGGDGNCWAWYADLYLGKMRFSDDAVEPTRISTGLATEPICDLAWSPSGLKIAFTLGSGCSYPVTESSIVIYD